MFLIISYEPFVGCFIVFFKTVPLFHGILSHSHVFYLAFFSFYLNLIRNVPHKLVSDQAAELCGRVVVVATATH